MLDFTFFRKLAKGVVPRFRKHTFIDAKDVHDRKFKNYSKKYGDAKRSGRLPRQATEFSQSTAPVLSSDLLRDYKLIGTRVSGFSFGFPVRGGRVEHLAKMGRVISTEAKAVPKKIENYIMKEANNYVNNKLRKIKGRTFNI